MIPILATACLLATYIKFSLPQLPGAEWNSLNTRLADRLRLLHNDLATDTLTPAEAGSNFESILQDFFAEIPDFVNNQNEQRSFSRREPKLLDEARKIKNRLRRRAFRQSSSKEDRDMFHAALATYTHLKKRRDEQTCERNAQHEERCFKRNFWDYSKKIVKDSLYSRSAMPTCSADTANDYFKSRYESPSSVDPSSLSWIPPLKNPISDFNTDPIRPKDVKNVLQRKSSHSSPGPDGIYYGMLKKLPCTHHFLATLYSKLLSNPVPPQSWSRSKVSLIHKKGDTSQPENFRMIALSSTTGKIFHQILADRIETFVTDNDFVDRTVQKGFLHGISGCLDHNTLVHEIIKHTKKSRRTVHITWFDLEDAFGSVPHDLT